jgi:hypothetical protein
VTWKKICEYENLEYDIDLVMKMGLQYSPNTLLLVTPLTYLTYKQSVILWYAISLFSLAQLALCIASFLKTCHFSRALVLSVVVVSLIAYKGTSFALLMGNPLFISSACGFAALNYINRAGGWISGLLMVLCSLKISMLFPFFVLIVFFYGWRKAIPSIISLTLFALLCTIQFYHLIPNYLSSLSILDSHMYEKFMRIPGEHSLISLNIDLKALLFSVSPQIIWLKWPIVFFLCSYGWINRQKLKADNHKLFIFTYLLLCMTFYHSYGDIAVVFPMLAILYLRTNNIFRMLMLLPAVTFLIPVNGILLRLIDFQLPLLIEVNLAASVFFCTVIAILSLHRNASNRPVDQSH